MSQQSHDSFLGYRLFRTQRVVHCCLENALEPYGITPSQWNSLNQLNQRGSMSQRQLAVAVRREPATITRSIDRLEKAGLVERYPDPKDRRANIIGLTDAGSALLVEVQDAVNAANKKVGGSLTPEEANTLVALLDRIFEACKEEAQ